MDEHTPWGLEFCGEGGGVRDGREWILPQHGPHTYMMEN